PPLPRPVGTSSAKSSPPSSPTVRSCSNSDSHRRLSRGRPRSGHHPAPPRRPMEFTGRGETCPKTPQPSGFIRPDSQELIMEATTTTAQPSEQERLPLVIRALNAIEVVGNRLPNPFWLFWILAAVLAVLSLILSAVGA